MLGQLRLKLASDVHEMGGVHKTATVEITLPVDVSTLQELLIKHHNDFLLSLSDHCSTRSERHIGSLDRANVEDTVADLELGHFVLREERRPEWEALHVQELA